MQLFASNTYCCQTMCTTDKLWFILILVIFVNMAKANFRFGLGAHKKCEVEAFRYAGPLPAVQLIYKLDMKLDHNEFGNNPYSHIAVKYNKGITKLEVKYDEKNQVMIFKKLYPPKMVNIEVVGYAVPVNTTFC